MEGAMVILGVMVVAGLLLYITDVKYFRHHHGERSSDENVAPRGENLPRPSKTSETSQDPPEICCGMHLVCEKTSLQVLSDKIEYYDDEELDRFAGRNPDSYTLEETEEFRDVLMTLLPQDVAGWSKSIRLRKIELPGEVKDELLMLISDMRG